ncbi:hypothetical protein [Massilia genomosp. 1]|uniref:Gll3595 protein n=1 Tax=Massilia genomosp. 1 TaxID=2609280 RepID=A0ABX0N3I4_9BURK|nr:hypothetical protein [Massilia genomosp. 1]NHZ64659.1 hypothetical protein [Massilia genomosp. 1]
MKFLTPALGATLLLSAVTAHAHQGNDAHKDGIHSAPAKAVNAPFDIVHTRIAREGRTAVFHIAVSGKAGQSRPSATGKLAGSSVFSYVWPTSLDPSVVGFDKGAGILAFAVTSHPDFDDTPLYDENGDGKLDNDGDLWHSHWVVLKADEACGKGALKVVDIPAGATPALPKTWPGLPLLIDSPGYSPVFKESTLEVRVPFDDVGVLTDASFDGVTAALRVNASVHSPLLCVANVFKVASGTLSLPGKVGK